MRASCLRHNRVGQIDIANAPKVEAAFNIADYSLFESNNEKIIYARAHLNEIFGQRYPERFTADDVVYKTPIWTVWQ